MAIPSNAMTRQAVDGRGEIKKMLVIPAVHLGSLEGFETTVVAYTTDIPAFEGAWGQPFLFGPGSIHVAHTLGGARAETSVDGCCSAL